MRSILFSMAALVVADNAFAEDHDVVHAGIVRRMNAHQDQSEVVHAGMVRQYQALQRQVVGLKRQNADAEKALAQCEDKAVKSGKARSAFVARLGACIGKLREVKSLSEQVKKDEGRLSDLAGRVDALEDRTGLIASRVADHEGRITDNETRTWEAIRQVNNLRENGPQAELVLGAVNHAEGMALAFGAGLSMPVAKGDWRFQTEALGSVGSGAVGFTAIGRGLVLIGGSGFVLGPNVKFHVEGPAFSRPANTVFAGAGGSVGWSGERFGVIADVSVGQEAHRVGQTDIAWASGILGQVKF